MTQRTSAPQFSPPRIASHDDIPSLVDIINRAYMVETDFVTGPRVNHATITQKFASADTWFVAIDALNQKYSPSMAGSVCIDCNGERGYIALLSVHPDYQGRGLGAALVRAAESHCRAQRRCRTIELEVVNLRTELFPFYAKLGYVPVGTAPFPDPARLLQAAHLVLMEKGSEVIPLST